MTCLKISSRAICLSKLIFLLHWVALGSSYWKMSGFKFSRPCTPFWGWGDPPGPIQNDRDRIFANTSPIFLIFSSFGGYSTWPAHILKSTGCSKVPITKFMGVKMTYSDNLRKKDNRESACHPCNLLAKTVFFFCMNRVLMTQSIRKVPGCNFSYPRCSLMGAKTPHRLSVFREKIS